MPGAVDALCKLEQQEQLMNLIKHTAQKHARHVEHEGSDCKRACKEQLAFST